MHAAFLNRELEDWIRATVTLFKSRVSDKQQLRLWFVVARLAIELEPQAHFEKRRGECWHCGEGP